MGYVYLITNKVNGKQYVGQTKEDDIFSRWSKHMKICKNSLGRYIYAAYKKYGIDKFDFKIICVCFDEDCDRYEDVYINKYGTIAPNGYNLRGGGGNRGKHHPDTIKRMSDKMLGRKMPPASKETRIKRSEGMKGEKNPNYGKAMSEEQKQKISNAQKHIWNQRKIDGYVGNINERSLKNLELGRRIHCKRSRKVSQYTVDGQYVASFDSTEEASRQTQIHGAFIRNVCNPKKRNKTAGGYIWKYVN